MTPAPQPSVAEAAQRNWPHDWPHDDRYISKCVCGSLFQGPKRAACCWACATEDQKDWWERQNKDRPSRTLSDTLATRPGHPNAKIGRRVTVDVAMLRRIREALELCPPDKPQMTAAEFREAVNVWWRLYARATLTELSAVIGGGDDPQEGE